MRGIVKRAPPRNVSPDGQERASMQQAERNMRAGLPAAADPSHHARAHFDAMDKKKLRAVLLQEQRAICVYCERRIKDEEGEEVPPIEHWRSLSGCPDVALHWRNLYLSCPFTGTCDDAKAHRRLRWDEADADLPWPVEMQYERCVGWRSNGDIYVRTDAPLSDAQRRALELAIADRAAGAAKRTAILNLNHPALREARAAAIDAERARMGRDFPNRTATTEEKAERAAAMLDESPYPPFVSIRVAWLRKELGKNAPPVEPAP